MIVLNDETEKLIKHNLDIGKVSLAGFIAAEYIQSKNPHENITLALKSIKEDLKEILSQYPESFYFGQIHFNILYEVFKELGWKPNFSNTEGKGWAYNIFIPINIPNKEFYYKLNCSWFHPSNYLEKIYLKNEEESNNC